MMRGVRGATTVDRNEADHVRERTAELVRTLVERNGIRAEDVASAIFTVTPDLDADFPAHAARVLPGWDAVPLLCTREIPVPGALPRCVRVLLHWNTERPQREIRHAYLRGATTLRPDLEGR
jgi:chorismate mutase